MKVKFLLLIMILMSVLVSCSLNTSDSLSRPDSVLSAETEELLDVYDSLAGDPLSRGTSVTADQKSPYIEMRSMGNNQFILALNLRPDGYPACHKVRVQVNTDGASSGYTLNIGNSVSNDAWGGDSGHTQYDSELQLYNNDLAVYANDKASSRRLVSKTDWVDGRQLNFTIENQKLTYNRYYESSQTISNANLFNLNSTTDYKLYVGVNRVVSTSSSRTGTGASSVKIYFYGKKSNFKNIEWTLDRVLLQDGNTLYPGGSVDLYWIQFNSDGIVRGEENCNYGFGSYSYYGNSISIDYSASKSGCKPYEVSDFRYYMSGAYAYSSTSSEFRLYFHTQYYGSGEMIFFK